MLCPQCQVLLTVRKYQSVEVSDCPQCHGKWLENGSLEKIIEQMKSVENPEKSLSNNQVYINKNSIQDKTEKKSQNKKRKHPHFLSGAFDFSDDW